ncbi:MAG: methyltransferase domain-containing protein [Deltaproteobacteria bacterium]|nr:methyltransferase domain-containing protein [Deltaproteobacteria bacterium]
MKGGLSSILRKALALPGASGLDPDAPETTLARREIIRGKGFLERLYRFWYEEIARLLPEGPGRVLEIGSGAGFLGEVIPDAITSEVFPVPGISLLADAQALPFRARSLKAVVMADVFHHIPDCARFLDSAAGCVREGGAVIMIEPWVTPFSRLIYGNFHHEPFDPDAQSWAFPSSGPLSGANGALPWMVFHRDREEFMKRFPCWRVDFIKPDMPFSYLLSGGVSMRSLLPGAAFAPVRSIEGLLKPFMDKLALFAVIRLRRTDAA